MSNIMKAIKDNTGKNVLYTICVTASGSNEVCTHAKNEI